MAYERLSEDELKQRLESAGTSGLALDIDDTLSYTDAHWYDSMMSTFANPETLTRDEIIAKYGWFDKVPYWHTEAGKEKQQEFVHSNEFNESIPPIEEAKIAVHEIHTFKPIVAYITARPDTVVEGTRRWLSAHGFPDAPLLIRSQDTDFTNYGSNWKAQVLHRLYPSITGIVDDRPDLAKQLRELGYQGTVYLYDNGTMPPKYADEERYRTWDEIATELRRTHAGS